MGKYAVPFAALGLVLALIWSLPLGAVEAPADAPYRLTGEAIQGGLMVGSTLPGSEVWQDDQPLRVSAQGDFLLGFTRDAPATSALRIELPDGAVLRKTLQVAEREYRIQRIDGLPERKVTPRSPEDLARIRRDAVAVKKARARDDDRQDFLSGFAWPVLGPITGVYGSQRVLNGEPRRPHFGVDVAAPVGTPVRAPAPGIVTLAEPDMFFSGGTLIIDHGHRLTSSFLHLHKLHAKVGERVEQGDVVAEVGATGRVTGAHLDWRMNLRDRRIDPELLVPPMPSAERSAGR
jgi:murein DD-endopeptidase MepM/ murein hydrolase activator NlpD